MIAEAAAVDIVGSPSIVSICMTIENVLRDAFESDAAPVAPSSALAAAGGAVTTARAPPRGDGSSLAHQSRGSADVGPTVPAVERVGESVTLGAPAELPVDLTPACVLLGTRGHNMPCVIEGAAAFALQGKFYLHGGMIVSSGIDALDWTVMDVLRPGEAFSRAERKSNLALHHLLLRDLCQHDAAFTSAPDGMHRSYFRGTVYSKICWLPFKSRALLQ